MANLGANLGVMGRTTVEITAPLDKMTQSLKKGEKIAKKSSESASKSIKKTGDDTKKAMRATKKAVDNASGSFERLRLQTARLRNATLLWKFAATATFIAVAKGIKDVVAAYNVQEDAERQLTERIRSTGMAAGLTATELKNMASELQGVTKFGDEAIIGMQSLLLTFTQIGKDTFPKATEAVLNVATAMGTDLKSAAVQVGKALNDPILGVTALARSGIQFSEVQKEVIKDLVETGQVAKAQALILKELEVQFGGAARAARDTFGGKTQSLSNAFGDTMEFVGGIIARVTSPQIEALTREITDLNNALAGTAEASITLDLQATDREILNATNRLTDYNITLGKFGKTIADLEQKKLKDLIDRLQEHRIAVVGDNEAMAESAARILAIKTRLTELSSFELDFFQQMEFARLTEELKNLGSEFENIINIPPPDKPFIPFEEFDLDIAPNIEGVEDALDIYRQIATPLQKYNEELAKATLLQEANLISMGDLALFTDVLKERYLRITESLSQMEKMGVSTANALTSAFGNWAASGFKNFDDYAKAFGQMLAQMVAEALAAFAIFSLLSIIGGPFAGFAAAFGASRGYGGGQGEFGGGDGGLGNGDRTQDAGSSTTFSPTITVAQPALVISLDGDDIRHSLQRSEAFDSRTSA